MSVHNATSKGNSWSCSAAWCLGQVVHRRDHQSPFPGNPFMTWENQPHFSKVILFYIPDITQIIIKYPQYLPYIPHTVFPKYIWKMHITPKYPRKISTKNTRNKDKTANAVYICLYLSFSIYIYLYLSMSIYICLYLSISISIYLYLSISISFYLYLFLSISIYHIYLYLSISWRYLNGLPIPSPRNSQLWQRFQNASAALARRRGSVPGCTQVQMLDGSPETGHVKTSHWCCSLWLQVCLKKCGIARNQQLAAGSSNCWKPAATFQPKRAQNL